MARKSYFRAVFNRIAEQKLYYSIIATAVTTSAALLISMSACSKDSSDTAQNNPSPASQPTSLPSPVLEIPTYYRDAPNVGAGDLNGDGLTDFVTAAYVSDGNKGSIIAHVANGFGGYASKEVATVPQYFRSSPSTTIADVNNDKKDDIIVGIYNSSRNTGQVFVFLNQGGLEFKAQEKK